MPFPSHDLILPHHHLLPLFQFIQMLQPRQNNLLTRLLNLPRQKHLVEDSIDLVKVEHQIQLTHIPEERIQHLDKEVYRLQVRELIVVGIDARAEEQSCIAAVDDLVVAEFDKVRLVLLVARGDEAVDLEREG
jgi:hypothetical protein